MKLAVVGAGSTYTPEVIDGIVQLRDVLTVDDLFLHDTNEQRLDIVSGLARRMLDRGGHPTRLETTTRLADAVEGADAVLVQIRVGGQAARMVDESVPVACGCLGQETTGFGGLAKALRNRTRSSSGSRTRRVGSLRTRGSSTSRTPSAS